MWREDDPPINRGSPREGHLHRRVIRLQRMNKRRPNKYSEELKKAEEEYEKVYRGNRNLEYNLSFF